MIVISKNKIIMYFGIFILIILTFVLFNNVNNINQTEETVTLPVSGKVIVIDAGHGKPDERSRKLNRNN